MWRRAHQNESVDEPHNMEKQNTVITKRIKKGKDKFLMSIFKSVPRDQQLIYRVIKPTHPLNDGRYNVNFSVIEKNPVTAVISTKSAADIKRPIELKPFCMQKNLECSYQSRQYFKNQNEKFKQDILNSKGQNLISLANMQALNKQSPESTQQNLNNANQEEGIKELQFNHHQSFINQQHNTTQDNTIQNSQNPDLQRKETFKKSLVSYRTDGLRQVQRDLSLVEIYDKMKKHIQSPIEFTKQIRRPPITKGSFLSEERFINFNKMPRNHTQFKNSPTPDFSKTSSNTTIDTFFGLPKDNQNAQNQIYNPNYQLVYQQNSVVDFKRFVTREYKERLEIDPNKPQNPYDSDKIVRAIDNLSNYRRTPVMANFEKIQGRDDRLMYKLNKSNIDDVPQCEIRCENYLPNSIKNSPLRREISHSYTTRKLQLRKHQNYTTSHSRLGNDIDINEIQSEMFPNVSFQQL
ncbi:UNKNOWN [Stylonychia lemnae]|uniref:Uncharacterized protein n=1 Tax=Stylonychia lemnae TaxID=5949 RepID=A0A078BAP3_STYLE|nr:UNKNOWN [Stylonychia lemnae]|eukprot:CDW90638.1 UNKNOWN [Stylonychia lemnae]